MKRAVLEALRAALPARVPEPRRRDRRLPRASTREHLRQIVEIQLRRLARRLAERQITLELTDAARDWLANRGYDPVYGARPLKRAIQREVETPLARQIVAGNITTARRSASTPSPTAPISTSLSSSPARRR